MTNLISLKNISLDYIDRHKNKQRVLSNVSLDIRSGETLGLVGESGSGKTTLGKIILQLLEPTEGAVYFQGEKVIQKNRREFVKQLQIIFQDPYTSLNPKQTALESVMESLIAKGVNRLEAKKRATVILAQVGFLSSDFKKYPVAFSGGQRQRIGIARAVVSHPTFILADEPISALDVSTQAQILNLLNNLKKTYKLTFLFISHDLGKVHYIADRVAVLYLGHLVELGSTEQIFQDPRHTYTKKLLSAIPKSGTLIGSTLSEDNSQLSDDSFVFGTNWQEIDNGHFVLE